MWSFFHSLFFINRKGRLDGYFDRSESCRRGTTRRRDASDLVKIGQRGDGDACIRRRNNNCPFSDRRPRIRFIRYDKKDI